MIPSDFVTVGRENPREIRLRGGSPSIADCKRPRPKAAFATVVSPQFAFETASFIPDLGARLRWERGAPIGKLVQLSTTMSISPVSSASAATYGATTTTTDRATIERQIRQLEQRIQAEQSSDDDTATKAQKLALMQAQLVLLQTQLTAQSSSSSS
jgi:hypothetical protein